MWSGTNVPHTNAEGAGQLRRAAFLTHNGSGCISRAMRDNLGVHGMRHLRTKAHHPQSIGRMERRHRTMKDAVTLVVHTTRDQLREAILSRRKHPRIRAMIAPREHYRRTVKNTKTTGTATSEVLLSSPTGLSHER